MIDEYYTWIIHGYHSDELSYGSSKRVIAVCENCGKYRSVIFYPQHDLCKSCAHIGNVLTNEHKQSIAKGNKGKKKPPRTKEHHNNMSKAQKKRFESEEERRKASEANMGNVVPDKTKRKISATMQNISIEDWEGFACEQKYCPKFNESIKELIRKKYNNTCFICDKTQQENIKQHKEKLSVHHTDLNKSQGCDDHVWKLVPLCKSCHGSSHSQPLKSRIEYLRADEEPSQV